MFRKSPPEDKFNCKCHDEQFHSNPQDDMIEKTEQVVIILQNGISNDKSMC